MRTILKFPRVNEAGLPETAALTRLDSQYGFVVKLADAHVSTPSEVAELLSFWKPDGCIVNNDKVPEAAFADYPTVFQHRVLTTGNPRHATISFDEKAVAETAARHLLSLDLASYAYIQPQAKEYWSQMRERHFVRILGLNGHGVAVFAPIRKRLSPPKQLARLANWLVNLPRPVGVFAANDAMAATVIDACDHANLAVPQDVAVIGVDNDERICEMTHPTLSSISPDVMTFCDESYRLLASLISGEAPKNPNMTVKPSSVVRRASTLRIKKSDTAVLAACELIRQRACEGLKARDVAATFPCGRRMAEIRFRAALGHSILDEIRTVRRVQAEMLTGSLRIHLRDEIAARCGYASWSSVHRLLKEPLATSH